MSDEKTSWRQFISLTHENVLGSNLTELDATYQISRGYMTHNDWLAHAVRYSLVGKYVSRLPERQPAPRLLDVGCGNMNLPMWFWRNKLSLGEWYGIDLRAKHVWLDICDWNVPLRLAQADIVTQRDELVERGWPATFDIVTCFEAFEHVPRNAQPVLARNLFRWTRPGGLCFFSTPNAGVSQSTAQNHLEADGESRERTYAEKLGIVRDTGFVVEETFGTFCALRNLPPAVFDDPVIEAAKRLLHHSWLTVFLAAAFPDRSNNAVFVMRRPHDGGLTSPMPAGTWLKKQQR